MTNDPITTELVVAYHQCKRKAHFLLRGAPRDVESEYEAVLAERARVNRLKYLRTVVQNGRPTHVAQSGGSCISAGDLEASCDALVQPKHRTVKKHLPYEPHLVVGTHSVSAEQKLGLAFAGYIIGEMRRYRPATGYLVMSNEKLQRVRLEPLYSTIQTSVDELRQLRSSGNSEPPPLILNKHCPTCRFRHGCFEEAEQEDNLSRLERMTPKLLQKYQKKGIFTVNQLSYVFKPRRRKCARKTVPTFNVELQALALRTGKIYVDEAPSISEQPVEIYLDIEGIPDQKLDYLIGLVIQDKGALATHSLWADSLEQEKAIFQKCSDLVADYDDCPIYHYGSYDSRAFSRVAKKYGIELGAIQSRLVNVNSLLFGKVYFPSMSNGLKALGSLCGATWDSPDASGLQSLVWRYRWEESDHDELKQKLISYNLSDCHALRLLMAELWRIAEFADSRDDVEFADHPKEISTDRGTEIHQSLERILTSAHADYRKARIKIRHNNEQGGTTDRTLETREGRYMRIVPKNAGKVIRVRRRLKCPSRHHSGEMLEATSHLAEHTVIDLVFTKSGCRKTVTKYVGTIARCRRCHREFNPPAISRFGSRLFGHAFQALAVYQRIVLRLPYRAIAATIEDLFGEHVAPTTILNFLGHLSSHYASTEKRLLERILTSPFIHVDETKLSIHGEQNYVWVLTDGTHVVFRLTETRESTMVHALLTDYEGVVVTDFYGGYDSLKSRKQKCLSHLIRDLNDDLWKNPFNHELESFVSAVRDLLVPIFDEVDRYGLKARNLRKHMRKVRRFYESTIDDLSYECDITAKYQKRFVRYRDSLFVFLEEDGIPWNNNTAERAIRHLAVQRKISGSFRQRTATEYLRLLGIGQTCRFQEKSFLRFLVSGEKDVDAYRERKRKKATKKVMKPQKLNQ